MKITILFLLNVVLLASTALAFPYNDQVRMKFGKLDMEELTMSSYAQDTGAAAVVLADVGRTYFTYNSSKDDFDIIFEQHCRIKILKNSGYDAANIEIPVYHYGTAKESVSGLKAVTYNLVNGKMTETKLERKNIFDEKQSENWDKVKFTMPNIAVGSVFEFTYRIVSNIWMIRGWEFQRDIPVAWSEYEVSVPEYYDFLKIGQGYEPFYKNSSRTESASISYLNGGRTEALLYTNYITYWSAKDLPGLANEKFIATPDDFATKVEFQIATIKLPGDLVRNIFADWPEVQKKFLEEEKFGSQINRSGFMKEELAAETSDCADDLCKAHKVYEFIRRNMQWNERSSMYCETNVRKAFTDRVGNSAEINLALVAALREADLQADPVILSERSHGRVHPIHPLLHRFNYVIAAVRIGGKDVLLDATDKFVVFGQLPARCLNYQGRMISKDNSRWINLQNLGQSISMTTAELTLGGDGTFEGKVSFSSNGYQAVNERKALFHSEEDHVKRLKDEKKNWEIANYRFENKEDLNKSLLCEYDVRIAESAQAAGDLIFIDPMLTEGLGENPFKQEKRKLPIDLNYPTSKICNFTINLPEGYEIDELPKPLMLSLPDNSGSFSFSISQNGTKLTIMSNYHVKKTFYMPEFFQSLKEFHNLIVAKHAEQIVLRKMK